jgi:hypothetical protein
MSIAAREFAEDPCASAKRSNMVRAARNLLSAVTRLLILADMVDVHLLLKSLRVVSIQFLFFSLQCLITVLKFICLGAL